MNEPDLFCDGASGIYIPQRFAREVIREAVSGVTPDQWRHLEAGPDAELYWDVWAEVLDAAVITNPETGIRYTLWQDGDLWLIPEGYEGELAA